MHIAGSTPKIPIGDEVKVSDDLCSGKCEHGGRSIVTQVCGGGGDAKFVIKYDKLESSVGTEYEFPLSRITVIPYPYFSSKMGGTDCVKQKPGVLQMRIYHAL